MDSKWLSKSVLIGGLLSRNNGRKYFNRHVMCNEDSTLNKMMIAVLSNINGYDIHQKGENVEALPKNYTEVIGTMPKNVFLKHISEKLNIHIGVYEMVGNDK